MPSRWPLAGPIRTFRGSLTLLATKRFGTFWGASLLSSIGTWTQQVAEPWLLLTLGASSFVIGLDSFAATAPMWVLTIVGGTLADDADRRRVIASFQSIQMLCPIAIVALLVSGRIHPWMIVALSVVVGVTDALSMPSFQSIVPSIVRPEEIAPGLALNSTQFNLSRVLGPSVAGLIMSSIGPVACFVISALSYIPFIGVAVWILPPRVGRSRPRDAVRVSQVFAGLREVVAQPRLRGALLTVLTTNLFCGPLVIFSPILVRDVFHGGAVRFSAAVASFGIGGLVGAAVLLGIGSLVDRRRLCAAFAIGYAVVVIAAALNRWSVGLPVVFMLAGAAMTMSNTSANAILQAGAKPGLLGRTVSLYMLALSCGSSVGAVLTGITVSAFGVQAALLFNGLTALVLQAMLARLWLAAP